MQSPQGGNQALSECVCACVCVCVCVCYISSSPPKMSCCYDKLCQIELAWKVMWPCIIVVCPSFTCMNTQFWNVIFNVTMFNVCVYIETAAYRVESDCGQTKNISFELNMGIKMPLQPEALFHCEWMQWVTDSLLTAGPLVWGAVPRGAPLQPGGQRLWGG